MKKVDIRITQQNNDLKYRVSLVVKDLNELADLFIEYKYEANYTFFYFIESVKNFSKKEMEEFEERAKEKKFDNYKQFQYIELLRMLKSKGATI